MVYIDRSSRMEDLPVEILHGIFQRLSLTSLRLLRHTSKRLAEAAASFTFHTLEISTERSSLLALEAISENELSPSLVKCIKFEPTWLSDMDLATWALSFPIDMLDWDENELEFHYDNYREVIEEQSWDLNNDCECDSIDEHLTESLKKLDSLQSLKMAVLPIKKVIMPYRYIKLSHPNCLDPKGNFTAIAWMLKAAARAGEKSLERLEITGLPFEPMKPIWRRNELAQIGTNTLRTLVIQTTGAIFGSMSKQEEFIRQLLSRSPLLQTLKICLRREEWFYQSYHLWQHIYPADSLSALRSLDLGYLAITEQDFCQFLIRRKDTLEVIYLQNIGLWEGEWINIFKTMKTVNRPRLRTMVMRGWFTYDPIFEPTSPAQYMQVDIDSDASSDSSESTVEHDTSHPRLSSGRCFYGEAISKQLKGFLFHDGAEPDLESKSMGLLEGFPENRFYSDADAEECEMSAEGWTTDWIETILSFQQCVASTIPAQVLDVKGGRIPGSLLDMAKDAGIVADDDRAEAEEEEEEGEVMQMVMEYEARMRRMQGSVDDDDDDDGDGFFD